MLLLLWEIFLIYSIVLPGKAVICVYMCVHIHTMYICVHVEIRQASQNHRRVSRLSLEPSRDIIYCYNFFVNPHFPPAFYFSANES